MDAKRVVVAMSGGVDSSVAAALLVQAGYQVQGIMLQLWSEPATGAADPAANRCCTPNQVTDAQRVAEILNIPFRTWDVAQLFHDTVVENFVQTYAAGLTPNPCLICNRRVRFGFLLEQARAMGADYMATGHYVRLRRDGGKTQLLCGVDSAKDQSYVLYSLNQSQLPHLLFPVGEFTKTKIRELAREFSLPVAGKAESQDICFLIDGDYRRFLRQNAPEAMRPGPILDHNGEEVGTHQGLPAYTIGQRKGLGISAPEPLYVLAIDPSRNALIVGRKTAIGRHKFEITDTRWVAGRPPAREHAFSAKVRIRYKSTPRPATITPGSHGRAIVHLQDPLSDISPGQAAVFYRGEVCLGGGTIAAQEPIV
jgi:tRNA-specific 2-thiouridylase